MLISKLICFGGVLRQFEQDGVFSSNSHNPQITKYATLKLICANDTMLCSVFLARVHFPYGTFAKRCYLC